MDERHDGILKKKEIAGSRSGPHVVITGGVHGDEFEPMSAIRRLSRCIDSERLAGRLTLIPVVNEPAYLRGERTADDELDLARTFPGNDRGSITQRIAFALSTVIRSADYYIDLHSGGKAICVWPMVGYMLHPDEKVLALQRRMAHAFGLPVIWGTDPYLDGRALSVARDASVPAIYAEYHGTGRCDPAGVTAYVEGCLNVLASFHMLERSVPDFTPKYLVEDERPGSGHMQICYPAPMTGLFEASVPLGDPIGIGDRIGVISDTLGDETITVRSSQSGLVLVLRNFSRVYRGDSLAVILETNHRG
ncbi:MAG: succinylglutamate desuccinylase/aspartoacylase family protein [Pirellulaceae bacterium]